MVVKYSSCECYVHFDLPAIYFVVKTFYGGVSYEQ